MRDFSDGGSINQPAIDGARRLHIAYSGVTAAIVVATFAFFGVLPTRDPGQLVRGAQCSVITEVEAGMVLGAPVRLMPTDGTICHYVATTSDARQQLFVVAKSDVAPPVNWAGSRQLRGVRDDASTDGDKLFVRTGSHAYLLVIPGAVRGRALATEQLQLARMLRNHMVVAHVGAH